MNEQEFKDRIKEYSNELLKLNKQRIDKLKELRQIHMSIADKRLEKEVIVKKLQIIQEEEEYEM